LTLFLAGVVGVRERLPWAAGRQLRGGASGELQVIVCGSEMNRLFMPTLVSKKMAAKFALEAERLLGAAILSAIGDS